MLLNEGENDFKAAQSSSAPHDYTVGSRKSKTTVVCGILCSLALK